MKYGDRHKYKCTGCGQTTYYKGEVKDRPHDDCPSGGTYKNIELKMICPLCKNIIKRESGDSEWRCKACGHRQVV